MRTVAGKRLREVAGIRGEIERYVAKRWDRTWPGPGAEHLIPIAARYVTPAVGGHLQHLFYWDSYFAALGLVRQGRLDLARSTLEALVELFERFGFVPNVNVESEANRSQPPMLSAYVRLIYEATGDRDFLAGKIDVLRREYDFWMRERWVGECGVNRFGHGATEDYLLRFYDHCLVPRLQFPVDAPPSEKRRLASHYLTEAESGADFCSRFLGRAGDFAAVEVNALLFGYERNLAWFAGELGSLGEAETWKARARERRRRFSDVFWNETRGAFLDWDFVGGVHSPVLTPAAFFALWTGVATARQAEGMAENLASLETDHGVKASDWTLPGLELQWDAPFGWPPYQFVVARGLLNYGFREAAERIAVKYCGLVERVFAETGELWEKYDVVAGGLRSAEYEVQTQVGWTAGVYLDFSSPDYTCSGRT